MYAKIFRFLSCMQNQNGKLPKDYKMPIQLAGNVKKSGMIRESGVICGRGIEVRMRVKQKS